MSREAHQPGAEGAEPGAPPLYKNMSAHGERPALDRDVVLNQSSAQGGVLGATASEKARASPGAAAPGTTRRSKTCELVLPLYASAGTATTPGKRASDPFFSRRQSVVMPLFAAEEEPVIRDEARRMHRRTSVSCVSLSVADLSAMQTSASSATRQVWRGRQPDVGSSAFHVPALVPPNSSQTASTAVFERTSFVAKEFPTSDGGGFCPVSLHVYDLSSGLLDRHSEELLGEHVPSMYHSAMVCYGLEFYFEGGIGIAASGQTRFGTKFATVALGVTNVPLSQFLEWVGNREVTTHQVHNYHLTRNNCHHFCSDAAEVLLGSTKTMPKYVFTTTAQLIKSPLGAAAAEVIQVTAKGTQAMVAKFLLLRVMERQASLDMMLHAVTACGVLALPPTATVLFRVENAAERTRIMKAVVPYVTALIQKQVLTPNAAKVYEKLCKEVIAGADTLYTHDPMLLADMFAEILQHNAPVLWGPPLNAMRVLVLHLCVCTTMVFHPKLLHLLLLGSRDFQRLLPDGRLSLVRLVCNLGACPQGAIIHQDLRFAPFWVSLIGQGLMDDSGIVRYTAAALASNLAVSIVTMTSPSLKRQIANMHERHPLLTLATIVLYNINYGTVDELPEPAFNMLLMALTRIMASCSTALHNIVEHSFRPRYAELLQRADSNESRALLCIVKTLDELYRW